MILCDQQEWGWGANGDPQIIPKMAYDEKHTSFLLLKEIKENPECTMNMLLPFITTVLLYPGHYFSFPARDDCFILEHLKKKKTPRINYFHRQQTLSYLATHQRPLKVEYNVLFY